MKRVYVSDNYLLVGHLRAILEQNHIACVVKNEHLIGGAGELPPIECWPELWVAEDFQADAARALVEAYAEGIRRESASGRPWRCPGCAETLEPQFSACWRCGEARPPGDPGPGEPEDP